MITRIVLIKLNDDHATETGRAAVVAHTKSVFAGLPGVGSFDVGGPADEHSTAAWDVIIRVHFDNLDQVKAYGVEPTHRDYVDNYLNPRAAMKKAWNFTS